LKKVSKTPKPKKCFKADKICILRIHASRPVTTCVKILVGMVNVHSPWKYGQTHNLFVFFQKLLNLSSSVEKKLIECKKTNT